MTSAARFVDRGFEKTLLLAPGWACDSRVFSRLDLKYNYLLVPFSRPSAFVDEVSRALKEQGLENVSIFGHSLGGFLALDFARAFPQKCDEVFLAGVRKGYTEGEISAVRQRVEKNKAAFLRRFYEDCFAPQDGLWQWFKEHLLKSYLEAMPSDGLLEGLDHLLRASIDPQGLQAVRKLTIFHGTEDRIAPFQEASVIAAQASSARFVALPGAGHMGFLNG